MPQALKILLVHAHHEPRSFCSALKDQALTTLSQLGHQVKVSDLYAQNFNPVSDRRNFITRKNPDYLKQQQEETFASDNHGFASDLEAEMQKVEWCDVLMFNFPLWWFGLPAILKGWVDRVFASGRMYGGGKYYENGVGRGKRALVSMTIGGPPSAYNGYGINPKMETILQPIHHGIFWFNGFQPLPPFLVHGPARMSEEERSEVLKNWSKWLCSLPTQRPYILPSTDQFDAESGDDLYPRWMVEVRRSQPVDGNFFNLIPAEGQRLLELKRLGQVLQFYFSHPQDPDWVGWLLLRAHTVEQVKLILDSLPLRAYLSFQIKEAVKSPLP